MRNRIVSVSLAVVFAMTLCAVLAPLSIAQAQQTRTLTVLLQDFHEPGPRKAIEEQLVPRFEQMHPGTKVEVSWTAWGDYVPTYVTLYLGGSLPDVVNVGSSALGQFAAQGIIQPVDAYMRNWAALDDFIPAAVQDAQIDGVFWAVPIKLDIRTLAYNRTYFDEAGLDRNQPPTNWAELEEYARRLTKYDQDGKFVREGFDVRPDIQHVLPFVLQAGGGYISADGQRTLLADNEAVEALEFLQGLIRESRVANAGANSLVNGQVAMLHEGTWLLQDVWSKVDIGIADPLRHAVQASHVHINRLGISGTAKHPDLAWEWIAFMMEPENLQLVLQESRAFPARISPLHLAPYSDDVRWTNWLNAALLAEPVPGWVPTLAEVVGHANAAYRDIFTNNHPVRTRLETMAEYVNNNVLNAK